MPKPYSAIEKLLFPATRIDEKACKLRFQGKTIVITGASYGIGEQLALMLGGFGANLVLMARTDEKLKEIQEKIQSAGGSVETYALDLRNEISLDKLILELQTEYEEIHYLIHCAGLSIRRSFRNSMERFHDVQRTNAINFLAPVKLSLGLFPLLQKTSGQIIYLSAINTLFPSFPKWAAYQASKSAFNQWLLGVQKEMKEMNVAATLVYLPLVRTRMIEPTKIYDNAAAMHPEHVAKWVIKAMFSRKKLVKPWWTRIAVPGTKMFKSIIASRIHKQQ